MTRISKLIAVVLLLSSSASVWAKDGGLPRVLVIGDSVYTQHCRALPGALKGRATVVFAAWPKEVVPNSTHAIKHLDQLLGYMDRNGKPLPEDKRPAWDLIHLNVGLGDLVHRAPDLESFRVLPIHAGGVVATSPKDYRKNLGVLIQRLKATGAKVVWASTTPIRHSQSNVFEKGSEVKYNQIALSVMRKHKVRVNDMYTHVKGVINMDKPAGHGADPFSFDKKPIHTPVVQIIEKTLRLKPGKPEKK